MNPDTKTPQRVQDTKALLDFLKSWNKIPNEEEIKTLIGAVLKYSQDMHGKTSAEVNKILKEMQNIGSQVMQKHDMSLVEHKNTLSATQQDFLDTIKKNVEAKLSVLKDGKTPTMEEILALIEPLIPEPIPGSPDTGIEIRNKLEHLEGEERLDVSAIKGLNERLKKIENRPVNIIGGGSTGGGRIVKSYDLSDQLNGVLQTFAMPAFYRIISVHLSSFPNILRPTTDYTVDGNAMTITFTAQVPAASSLTAGQTLIVVYSDI